jgi:arylsulfatase A-like enzyme
MMNRLHAEGLAFARATAQAPWTLASTASMMSGKLPTEHGITGDCFRWEEGRPTSPAEAVRSYSGQWLPEALHRRGYRTWGASCNTWISSWGGFDRGFETFLDLRDRTRLPKGRFGSQFRRARRMWGTVDRGGREALRHFEDRLADVRSEPLFAFVNLMETHAPYDPPRPYYPYPFWRRAKTRRLSGGTEKARRFLSYNTRVAAPPDDYVGTIRSLYYRAACYEDWLLGKFVQAVERRGRPAVVVVLSDHGENLGEEGLFNHNSSLGQTLLHVPLVLWGYQVEVPPARVEEPVSLLGLPGLLQSLADGEGMEFAIVPNGPVVSEYESTVVHNGLPPDILGMLEGEDPSKVPALVFHPGVAVRGNGFKYVAVADGTELLYDVEADPVEETNLASTRPDLLAGFHPYREEWEKRAARQPRYLAGERAEDEIAEHLRTLGYID